jgi:hypothetical protein
MTPICTPGGEKSSDGSTPRSILRSMDGAKDFLDPVLLDVPWLWRKDPVRVQQAGQVNASQLREYGKAIRTQVEVVNLSYSFDVVASSWYFQEQVSTQSQIRGF